MTPPIHGGGQRLGDAIRAALDAGDVYAARRLALVGAGAGTVGEDGLHSGNDVQAATSGPWLRTGSMSSTLQC
jgi:hypothetical protein